jgi:hypothetical protein
MHAETRMTAQEDVQSQQPQAEAAGEQTAARVFGSLMDVLMPATPPEPKNARIVRQFDLEAAKNDPQPVVSAAAQSRPQTERRSREEARAHRNRSLRAAAGFSD